MRRTLAILTIAALIPVAPGALAQTTRPVRDPDHPSTCKTCGTETYGTTIDWAGSPSEAAHQAKAEGKLVFVLHVSGHFEDPAFT